MAQAQEPKSAPSDEDFVILVEWPGQQGGVVKASRGDPLKALQEQSQNALDYAMGTIRAMSYRVAQTVEGIEDRVRPDEAEVTFGINLDAEAGAMLAKASAGAQITVKLKWTIEQPKKATVLVSE